MTRSELIRLGLTVFVAVSFVVLGDTAGKLLTQTGVEPFIVAWTRFLIAAIVLLPLSGLRLAEIASFKDWRVIARAAAIAAGISCILTGLKTEPIANVFGAFFVGPIVSYVLAVVFLGERPRLGQSMLLGLGFLGVMLVVKPGFGATDGMVFALAAGVFYGAYLALTRATAGAFRPRLLLISQLILGAILLTPIGVTTDWPAPSAWVITLIVVSALGSAAGNYLLVRASKTAEASLIAPLVYTQLISATLAGVLVFDTWPDALALAGLAIILLSGFGSLVLTRRV